MLFFAELARGRSARSRRASSRRPPSSPGRDHGDHLYPTSLEAHRDGRHRTGAAPAEATRSWLGAVARCRGRRRTPYRGRRRCVADLVGSTSPAQTVNRHEQNLAPTRFEDLACFHRPVSPSAVQPGDPITTRASVAGPTAEVACSVGTKVCRARRTTRRSLPPAGGQASALDSPRVDDSGPSSTSSRARQEGSSGKLAVTQAVASELPSDELSLHPVEPAGSGIKGPDSNTSPGAPPRNGLRTSQCWPLRLWVTDLAASYSYR